MGSFFLVRRSSKRAKALKLSFVFLGSFPCNP
jgi:hypothetical protein